MAEPRIQYAKTSDGVSIAFYAIGSGPPLIAMPMMPVSHLQLEWQTASAFRAVWEGVAAQATLVRYDSRGIGLSDRDIDEFSLSAMVRDVEAVVSKLEFSDYRLLAYGWGSLVAIEYAVRHPERVSHLVLWHGAARAAPQSNEVFMSFVDLAEKDWESATEGWMRATSDWSSEEAAAWAAIMRECITPATLRAFTDQATTWDVTDRLGAVSVPTLVGHNRQYRFLNLETSRELAAAIPEATLALCEGSSFAPGIEGQVAIGRFLGFRPLGPPDPELPSGTTVILFLDIADSTALTSKLGDAAYREKERRLDASLRRAIRDAGGTPVEGKLLGDGVMAVFSSARQAIDAALLCRDLGNEAGLPLHLGIHAGDVIREGNDVHGGAVQLAARIHDVAAPGEILVSDTLRGLARTSAGVLFEDRGEHELKGIAEPVRLFAVQERD